MNENFGFRVRGKSSVLRSRAVLSTTHQLRNMFFFFFFFFLPVIRGRCYLKGIMESVYKRVFINIFTSY